ncbi:MAG: serine/threonine protein kinase [Coprococcus sp.]
MMNTWPGWQNKRLLGEGSFGKVYEIYREEFGFPQRAALKVITIPQSASEIDMAYQDGMDQKSVTDYFHSFVEELVSEFALMYQLKGNNTNVVSYEDHMVVQHEDSIGWDILIRMELLTPLPEYIATHPLSELDVVHLGIDICHALEICRNYGLIHRDIKPENIFWSEDTGFYKLGDFGVARVAEKTVSNFSKKGTYSYMAPEVYRGLPYSFSVDIYSLGIVLYRYLNHGRLPFLPKWPEAIRFSDRETALERRIGGVEVMPEPDNGSQALKAAVLKACAYDPKDRFATPTEFRQALEAVEDEIKAANTIDVEEDAGQKNLTVGFFGEKTIFKKEQKAEEEAAREAEAKKQRIEAEQKHAEAEEKSRQEAEEKEDIEAGHHTQKADKKAMPVFYRVLGIAVTVVFMLICYLILCDSSAYDSHSFSVTFRMPLNNMYVRNWIGDFYYDSNIEGLLEDGLSVCLRLLPVVLICIFVGNLLEILISGKSHILGITGRFYRIAAAVLTVLTAAAVYLRFYLDFVYIIGFLFQIRAGFYLTALVEAAAAIGMAYFISHIVARILYAKTKKKRSVQEKSDNPIRGE